MGSIGTTFSLSLSLLTLSQLQLSGALCLHALSHELSITPSPNRSPLCTPWRCVGPRWGYPAISFRYIGMRSHMGMPSIVSRRWKAWGQMLRAAVKVKHESHSSTIAWTYSDLEFRVEHLIQWGKPPWMVVQKMWSFQVLEKWISATNGLIWGRSGCQRNVSTGMHT